MDGGRAEPELALLNVPRVTFKACGLAESTRPSARGSDSASVDCRRAHLAEPCRTGRWDFSALLSTVGQPEVVGTSNWWSPGCHLSTFSSRFNRRVQCVEVNGQPKSVTFVSLRRSRWVWPVCRQGGTMGARRNLPLDLFIDPATVCVWPLHALGRPPLFTPVGTTIGGIDVRGCSDGSCPGFFQTTSTSSISTIIRNESPLFPASKGEPPPPELELDASSALMPTIHTP